MMEKPGEVWGDLGRLSGVHNLYTTPETVHELPHGESVLCRSMYGVVRTTDSLRS